jgi:pimeloyl-ACP methyl ester carboxylesterase
VTRSVADERCIALDDGAVTTLESWGDRGPVLLGVHGMTSSRKSWRRLAEFFDGRFRVMAYDQRGHGDSAGVYGPMSLARGVRDLENVVTALGEPVDNVIGHSWGGTIAIIAGSQLPVRRVAAVDPMIRQVAQSWYEEYLEELRELFAFVGDARDARTREDYAAWAPVDVEAKVHAVRSMTTAPIQGLMSENPPDRWDVRAVIARFRKPLLLALAAPTEGINDAATLEDVERNHPPNVEIVTFPDAGHNLHRSAFDAFVRTLNDFLEHPLPESGQNAPTPSGEPQPEAVE